MHSFTILPHSDALCGRIVNECIRRAQRIIWRAVLWPGGCQYVEGGVPDTDSDSDYSEYDDGIRHWSGRCMRNFVNPLYRLAFGGALNTLLDFLGDFQACKNTQATIEH